MTNKEINRESGRIFEALLLPSWAFRSQEDQEDYGVDGEIEITSPEDKATGFIFKVQLKGTESATYDGEGKLVFSGASVERFSYYKSQVRIPLIFVVCDVLKKDCYWLRVQGNRDLEATLQEAISKDQQTFTVKLSPLRRIQKTQESAAEIVDAVGAAADAITLRTLQGVSMSALRAHLRYDREGENAEKTFRLFAGIAANDAIRKHLAVGDIESALEKARETFESQTELVDVRILAGAAFAHVYEVGKRRSGAVTAGVDAARFRFGVASKMIEIARHQKCQKHVRRYARIYLRASRMLLNSVAAHALAASEKTQALQGETMAGPFTQLQRMEVSAKVTSDYVKLLRAIVRLGNGSASVIPYALCEIAGSILPFVSSLRFLERYDLAEGYVNTLFELLAPSLEVLKALDEDGDARDVMKSMGIRLVALGNMFKPGAATNLLDRFAAAARAGHQLKCTEQVVAELQEFIDSVQVDATTQTKPTMDQLRSFFAQRAAELGVNLDDPNDQFGEVIRIGLEDLDPTRVLKDCEQMHVAVESYGVPAEMLGLFTAGSKRVVCLKHGHSVSGLRLDKVYEMFAKKWPWDENRVCCENCPDKTPHPEGWEWSDEWGQQQHAKYMALKGRRGSGE